MKKIFLFICLLIGASAFATPTFSLTLNSPYVYCEGSEVEMWFQGHLGTRLFTGNHSVYEIFDDQGGFIERIVVDNSVNANTTAFSSILPVGSYCVWGNYGQTAVYNPFNNGDVICFEIVAAGPPPTIELANSGPYCTNSEVCFNIQSSDSYSLLNVDYGGNGFVPFNGNPYCPVFNNAGTYNVEFTVETDCGVFVLVQEVTIENCTDCDADASFTYTRTNCNEFEFTGAFGNYPNVVYSELWFVDGALYPSLSSLTLSPGTHTICRSVLTYVEGEGGNTCCDEYCEEIIIPETVLQEFEFDLCHSPGVGTWFQPSSEVPYAYYTLTDPAPNDWLDYDFDSRSSIYTSNPSSTIAHFLVPGYYEFNFYDEYGCIVKIVSVDVIDYLRFPTELPSETVNLSFCDANGATGKWFTVCDLFGALPSDWVYTITDPDPNDYLDYDYNSDSWSHANGGNGCITHKFVPGSYVIDFYDRTNCTKKQYIINVVANAPTTSSCHEVFEACEMFFNLDGMVPTDCPGCYDASRPNDFVVGAAIFIGIDPFTGAEQYQKEIYDKVNCHVCSFSFEIVSLDDLCQFEINVQKDRPGFPIHDLTLDPIPNQCGPTSWMVYDGNPDNGAPLIGQFFGDQVVVAQESGPITVVVTQCQCICGEECCKSVTFETGYTVGKPGPEESNANLFLDVDYNIVPNPATTSFSIDAKGEQFKELELVRILSQDGSELSTFTNVTAGQALQIEKLSSGVYVVEIVSNEVRRTLKLVKK